MSILSVGDINYKQPRQESYGHLTAEQFIVQTADSKIKKIYKQYLTPINHQHCY